MARLSELIEMCADTARRIGHRDYAQRDLRRVIDLANQLDALSLEAEDIAVEGES